MKILSLFYKICEVFTKEYRNETKYREYAHKKIPDFRLSDSSDSAETKIRLLIDQNFVSNFKLSVGNY